MNAVMTTQHDALEGFLTELSDLYLWDTGSPEGLALSWCNLGSAKNIRLPGTPLIESGWVAGLLAKVREEHPKGDDDFAIEYDDMRFRGHRDYTVGGHLLALRRQTMEVPLLSDLLLPTWWEELLLQRSLCKEGGLIVMAAALGCGKSTTIAATIRSRLEAFAGHARCVEDPPEMPLDGFWGDGVCVQCPVDSNSGKGAWGAVLRKMLRAYPSSTEGGQILFIGEIRDADVAAEAIRAAVNGQLVITTIHASSVITAIKRLIAFGANELSQEVAQDMVASALRLVMTQGLRRNPNPEAKGWHRRIIEGTVLASTGDQHPVGMNIRDGKFHLLAQSFDRLRTLMAQSAPANRQRMGQGNLRQLSVEDLLKETRTA